MVSHFLGHPVVLDPKPHFALLQRFKYSAWVQETESDESPEISGSHSEIFSLGRTKSPVSTVSCCEPVNDSY